MSWLRQYHDINSTTTLPLITHSRYICFRPVLHFTCVVAARASSYVSWRTAYTSSSWFTRPTALSGTASTSVSGERSGPSWTVSTTQSRPGGTSRRWTTEDCPQSWRPGWTTASWGRNAAGTIDSWRGWRVADRRAPKSRGVGQTMTWTGGLLITIIIDQEMKQKVN